MISAFYTVYFWGWVHMSPVSPVFHTEVTVSIDLKNVLGVEHWVKEEFIKENRLRHASGPVQYKTPIPLHTYHVGDGGRCHLLQQCYVLLCLAMRPWPCTMLILV